MSARIASHARCRECALWRGSRVYPPSSWPGILMSLTIPGNPLTKWRNTGSRWRSLRSVWIAGLTRTSPAMSSGRFSARRRVSEAPIDRPMTNTESQRSRKEDSERSASAYQSSHRVTAISCQEVPWPGSRGNSTVSPAAARCSAHARMDLGDPVNPWSTRAPTGPPAWEKGSAPGIRDMSALRIGGRGRPPQRWHGVATPHATLLERDVGPYCRAQRLCRDRG